MARYQCSVCGYVYDEQQEGTPWSSLPADWVCPVCGAAHSKFQSSGQPESPGSAPPGSPRRFSGRVVLAHRLFGYVFLSIYLVLLIQMVPRLWTYQIELPPRTVLHVALGMAVGTLLLLKIGIVRFFRRLDPVLVPALGSSVLVGSVLLIGISVPPVFREAAATARLLSPEVQQRVSTLLITAGLDAQQAHQLAGVDSLLAGQRVLRQKCVDCHDLRTVLARPRTPSNWRQTVSRMAERTATLSPISETEQLQVTAHLVAISPELQRSTQDLRELQQRRDSSQQAAEAVVTVKPGTEHFDAAAAEELFQQKCSQCHKPDLVAQFSLDSQQAAAELVARMVDEGLDANHQEISQIVRYLTETYVK